MSQSPSAKSDFDTVAFLHSNAPYRVTPEAMDKFEELFADEGALFRFTRHGILSARFLDGLVYTPPRGPALATRALSNPKITSRLDTSGQSAFIRDAVLGANALTSEQRTRIFVDGENAYRVLKGVTQFAKNFFNLVSHPGAFTAKQQVEMFVAGGRYMGPIQTAVIDYLKDSGVFSESQQKAITRALDQ